MGNTHNEKKSLILEAAKKVAAEQGFEKLNYRSIAREAKISPGTLYYYYNSKDELLYDIMDSTTRELSSFVDRIDRGVNHVKDIPKNLYLGARNHIKNVDRNKIFLHVIHEALSERDDMRERIVDKYRSWVEDFEKLFRLYYNVPAPTCNALAILYDSMIDGLLIKELLGFDPLKQTEVRELLKLFLNGQFGQTPETILSVTRHNMKADC